MTEYVYRVETLTGLENIRDNHFRAKRWIFGESGSFPHELLKQLTLTLPATDGIFRICFYTSHGRAEESKGYDFSYFGESFILRCPKASVMNLGFSESYDDGFKEGDAYLFWIQENILTGNKVFSSVGIALHLFEIWKQGQWHALHDHYREMLSVAPSS